MSSAGSTIPEDGAPLERDPSERQPALKSAGYSSTFAYFYAFIALGLAAAVLGPTLPALANQTHSDLSQISFLFIARSFGYLLGSLLLGSLYDRISGHRLMAAVLALMIITLALIPVLSLLWLMIAIFLLLGIGEGAVDVGGNVLLVWTHRQRVGPFMNGMHFFFGLGALLSPIIIAQTILITGNFHWAYWFLALFAFPLFLWLPRLANPAAPQHDEQNPSTPVNPWIILLIASFFFLYVGSEAGYGGWIFSYALKTGLGNEVTAAYLTSLFWGSFTVGRLVSIPLAVKFKPNVILLADLSGCLVALSAILVWPGSEAAIWIGTAGVGLAMASIFPTMLAFAERRINLTGRVTGWFFVGVGAGAMTVPWVIGQLFEGVGPGVTMDTILASMLADSLVFFLLSLFLRKSR